MNEKCHVCEREKGKMPLCGRGLPGATFADLADCYQVAYGLARRDVATAEERGRRAGIEEAEKALWEHRRHGGIYVGGTPEEIVRALAPRDSGKEMDAAEEAIAAKRKARQDEEAEAFKYADENRK